MKSSIGICTWSLKNNPFDVAVALEESGLTHLHLEVVATALFQELIEEKDLTVSCTMLAFPQEDYSTLDQIRKTGGIVPDDSWELNRKLVIDAIERTAKMSVDYLSFHAGFIDHEDEVEYKKFGDRMSELADVAQENGILLLLETGQEAADELHHFLKGIGHPALGVNFDPANMILYGKGDPIEAVRVLAPWIKHVHIKDATASAVPGEWGTEVPWGDGEVDCSKFIQTLEEIGYTGVLAIEREAGIDRVKDIVQAAKLLEVE